MQNRPYYGIIGKARYLNENMKTFQQQFLELKSFLERNDLRFLVVGGVAVQHYGYSRATMDIDLMMVIPDDFAFVDKLRAAGFTYYSIAAMAVFGKKPDWSHRVDFIKVDTLTFSKLMAESVVAQLYGIEVRMPSLKHLIAMKFHAYKQGGARRIKDFHDIVWLSVLNDLVPERDLRDQALRYADENIYREVVSAIKATGGEG